MTAVAVTGTVSVAAAADDVVSLPNYPVTWSLAGGFFADPLGGLDPESPPVGSNRWDCEPSAAHPEPVILLHGLGGNQKMNFPALSPLLANNGYCVFSLTFGNHWWLPTVGGLQSMRTSGAEVKALVDKVLTTTGAAKVNLVAHSEGSTVAQYYMKVLGGSAKVNNLVGFSPNYRGTTLYGLTNLANILPPGMSWVLGAACTACIEFYPGSRFMADLNPNGTVAVPGVTYTNIQGAIEEVVLPNSSGRIEGVPNATNHKVSDGCHLDFSDHVTTVTSKRAAQIMLNALHPASAKPLPCEFNPGFLS